MKRPGLQQLYISCAIALAVVQTAPAQQNYLWTAQQPGPWNNSGNWSDDLVPEAAFDEVGVINNAGTATINTNIAEDPGGVALGQGAADSGTLHIQSGGVLDVVVGAAGLALGTVTVGGGGTGTLNVDRGGTLNAVSLQSGGNANSTINLGGGNSGTATVNISGNSRLLQQTRIVGPNVALSTDTLFLGGTLTAEFGAGGNSVISVNDTARLSGALQLEFTGGFVPDRNQTFDIVDAETITGGFRAIDSNVSLGPGLAYMMQSVPGGTNGTLARVGVDVLLRLQVDRRTGETRLLNLAEQDSVLVNGYGITSGAGALDDSQWLPFNEGGPWQGNGSSTHVTELSYGGSREIGPGADIDLGNIFDFQPTMLGEELEDLSFQYHVDGGNVVRGAVDYVGAQNNLVLVVDEEEGVFLQNQSVQDLVINAYSIVSESGGLNAGAWTSLFDGGNLEWTEANAANNHITELNQSGSLFLPAEGLPIPLGEIHSAGAARDLQFEFNIAGQGPFIGLVDYGAVIDFPTTDLPGDYNGDGVVNAADYTDWRDGDSPDSSQAGYQLWKDNFGATAGAGSSAGAVPEPCTLILTGLTMIGVLAVSRSRCHQDRG